jgi:hypothetical protein
MSAASRKEEGIAALDRRLSDKRVEHEYFYAVHDADSAKLGRYLEPAHQLGREY